MSFYARVRVPKDEKVDAADSQRRQKLMDLAMENIERLNQISKESYEDGKLDDSAQYAALCGDWFDRLTGK